MEFDVPANNKAYVPICNDSIYGLYQLKKPNRVRLSSGHWLGTEAPPLGWAVQMKP